MNNKIDPAANQAREAEQLSMRLNKIKNKIMILSGKGGVGKSTIAANIAMALSKAGQNVGLLDIDIHGPSIPQLLGLENKQISGNETELYPVTYSDHLKVISIAFLIPDADDAVIWRGPLKYNVIKQFLKDVVWGELDYLIVDSPPGTGDEPLSVAQLIGSEAQAVVVTTPQKLSIADVRKSIRFCNKLNVAIIGIVENMSGFVCPHCNESIDIFKSGGGQSMAEELHVPFLGKIPIDPDIVKSGDSGEFYLDKFKNSPAAKAYNTIIEPILNMGNTEKKENNMNQPSKQPEHIVKIAIPTANGELCPHFGHCQQFALIEADTNNREIITTEYLTPPAHEPGVLPKWLHEQGANIIISGGMGMRAQQLFEQNDIEVIVGSSSGKPEIIVKQFLDGTLQSGTNICDH